MDKNTKITLQEIIRRKEQMLESKRKPKTATLYIKSLGGTITIESPQRYLLVNRRIWITEMHTWCIPV